MFRIGALRRTAGDVELGEIFEGGFADPITTMITRRWFHARASCRRLNRSGHHTVWTGIHCRGPRNIGDSLRFLHDAAVSNPGVRPGNAGPPISVGASR